MKLILPYRPQKIILFLIATVVLFSLPTALFAQSHDPYEIFLRHYEATGGLERWKSIKSTQAYGTVIYDGLKGKFRSCYKKTMRFYLYEDFKIINQQQGDDGKQTWLKDTNGKVLINRDEETLKRRQLRELYERFLHIERNSQIFTLHFDGSQFVGRTECLVVRITNTINRDIEWYFFDPKTYYLLKTIEKQPDIEIQTQYSDFRSVKGFVISFHKTSHIAPRDKTEICQTDSFEINPELDDSIFNKPEDSGFDFTFEQGKSSENIPLVMEEDSIFLPVTIGCDTQLWALDTGASGTVIDEDYARKLGMLPEGEIKGFGFGENFNLSFVKIPQYKIKGLSLQGQTVMTFKGLTQNSYEPRIYGIIGYDFLSRFISKIDYATKNISFYDKQFFTYQGKGILIDAPLKNNTFTLPVTVERRYKGRWSLDTGASSTTFHFKYSNSNSLLEKKGPTVARKGMSGVFLQKEIRFDDIELHGLNGNLQLVTPVIAVPLSEEANSTGELAGNLGNSTLKHFVVYLDYEKQQVILEPGIWFDMPFMQNASGITAGLNDYNEPIISYLDPDSPAARAGFKEGDIFTAINEIQVHHLKGIRAIKAILQESSARPLHITVKRGETCLQLRLGADS